MPEILAPGVALFDYDNDGDLDVFVRAGPDARRAGDSQASATRACEARLYRNDLTFTPTARGRCSSPTSPTQSGIDATGYGMGVATRRLRQRRLRRSVRHQLRREPAVPQQLRRHVHRLSRRRAARPMRAGASRRRSSTTIATAGSTSTSATTCDYSIDGEHEVLQSRAGARTTARPNVYQPQPGRLFHNNRNGTFTDVTAAAGIATRVRPGARRRDRRLQRRRLDRPLRRQRRPAEPALDQPARRHVQEHGAARRAPR